MDDVGEVLEFGQQGIKIADGVGVAGLIFVHKILGREIVVEAAQLQLVPMVFYHAQKGIDVVAVRVGKDPGVHPESAAGQAADPGYTMDKLWAYSKSGPGKDKYKSLIKVASCDILKNEKTGEILEFVCTPVD